MGLFACWIVVGFAPLNPKNVGWLEGWLDPTQHYLGWLFYRSSPWSYPVGLNPSFGLDISSSIVYTDSIPLLAIFFKIFSKVLSPTFQYFGIWILSCFVLQAIFAWKLVGLIFKNFSARIFGVSIFLFSPPMLWRLSTHSGAQIALVSHFLILAALFLTLSHRQRLIKEYWTALLIASELIHFYLFMMVFLLWCGDCLNQYIRNSNKGYLRGLFIDALMKSALIFFVAWQAGYFSIQSKSAGDVGYGFFRLNLLAPFSPEGWSYVLGNIEMLSTWGEGYNYLGLGVIVMGLVAIPALVANYKRLIGLGMQYLGLVLILVACFFFSITNNVGIGMWEQQFELPTWITSLASIFRSAGRFFWPIYYALILVFLYCIKNYYSKSVCNLIIASVFLLQVVDTSAGWVSIRKLYSSNFSGSFGYPELKNDQWNRLGNHYKKLILIPAGNKLPYWENFAAFSARHHLSTNALFTARIDAKKVQNYNSKLNTIIDDGTFEVDALYIIEDGLIISAMASADRNSVFARLNQFNVVAPDWKACKTCTPFASFDEYTWNNFVPILNQKVIFSNYAKDLNSAFYLRKGWSWLEDWGVWSDSSNVEIDIPLPNKQASTLTLDFKVYVVTQILQKQILKVTINNEFIGEYQFLEFDDNQINIALKPSLQNAKFLKIQVEIPNASSPNLTDATNADKRTLGIGLKSIQFN